MGKPVFTAERQERYLEALRKGGRRVRSAKEVGISADTLYRFAAANPEFARAMDLAELEAVEVAETKLFEAMEAGEPWAIRDVLRYRGGERWRDPDKRIDVSVTVGGTVEHTHRLEAVQTLRETLEARAVEVRELTGGETAPERKEPAP